MREGNCQGHRGGGPVQNSYDVVAFSKQLQQEYEQVLSPIVVAEAKLACVQQVLANYHDRQMEIKMTL